MTRDFRYTLLGDGSSDRCLSPIINWVLNQIPGLRERGFVAQIADLRAMNEPVTALWERLESAVRQFPCEVLFVHRDAEGEPLESRQIEIREAALEARIPPYVPVVPVRMTEAWLLIEEHAIRQAADNPHGEIPLPIPPLRRLEAVSNPKSVLHECLILASEKRGRRLDQFRRSLASRIHRVADLTGDFSPLRQLCAFQAFEEATLRIVESSISWSP